MKDTDLGFDPGEIDSSGYSVDDIISEVHARDGSAPKTEPRKDLAELLGRFGVSPNAHTASAPSAPPLRTPTPQTPAPQTPTPQTPVSQRPAPVTPAPQTPVSEPQPVYVPGQSPGSVGEKGEGPDGFDIRDFEPELDEHDYPDATEDAFEDDYEEESSVGGIFTRKVMLLLCSTLAALMLIGIAVVPDLLDPAWSILVFAGIAIECVPLVLWTYLYFRDRSRSLAPLVMLVSGILCAAAAELVVLGVSLAIFNVCFIFYDNFARGRLALSRERLETLRDGMDPARDMRLDSCLKELESGRVKSVVALKRVELLIVAGVAASMVILLLIAPLFDNMDFMKWIARASVVLAACVFSGEWGALMSVFNAVEALFENGVWIGSTGTIDAAADVTSVLFNKSGTITDGAYKVTHVDPVRLSEDQLLYLAVYAGAYSEHPLNKALREYAGITPDKSRIQRQRIEQGFGSLVQLEDNMIVGIGNIDFMEKLGVKGDLFVAGSTCVFVSVGRVCVGRIDFADTIRPDAVTVVHDLRRVGVANVALMTGDNALCATNTGKRVGINEVYSDCRPSDKLERLQYILGTLDKGDRACFVTTAGSERELLEIANLSVTLGIGNDATAAFPDTIIENCELSRLPKLLRVARQVRRNVTVTFLVSSVIRAVTAILGVFGVMPLWLATLLMCALMALGFMNSNVDA